MARATFVKKARKDIPNTDIKAGDSYYWWKFRYGGKRYSKIPPKRSDLTQSSFLSQLYDIQDSISDFDCGDIDEFNSFKDDILSKIEELKDECQCSFDNIPEQLQSGSSAELLQERIDALDGWYYEIENIDCDVDVEQLKEELMEERGVDSFDDSIQDELDSKIEDLVRGFIDDLQGADSGI